MESQDEEAREAIQGMLKSLEEIWELREALGRERKYASAQRLEQDLSSNVVILRTTRFHKGFDKRPGMFKGWVACRLLVGIMSENSPRGT